jgi:hypothetical protein
VITLVRIRDADAVVACVADAIVVLVDLYWIVAPLAVVFWVSDLVTVHVWKDVADVAPPVVVPITLVWVRIGGAVVPRICCAIAVGVWITAELGYGR